MPFDVIGPLSYTPTLARALEGAGWCPERKRGEPTWWHDPMRLVGPMRTGEAWLLMMKRKANGIGRPRPETDPRGRRPSRMTMTLEKYRAGKLLSLDEFVARLRSK